MKGNGYLSLLLMLILVVGLAAANYYGIGKDKKFRVSNIKQGLDLSGGVHILYEADKETVTSEELDSAVSLIQKRLDWNNWTEAEAAKEGEKRIRVDIPGVEDAEKAIKDIGQTAQLQFVDEQGKVLLTGDKVADAQKEVGAIEQNGAVQPYISLRFDEEGTALFAQATKENIGKPIAIILDNEVISAPIVNAEITDGNAMITGSFTPEEAERTANLIRSGSLPFNLNVLQMENVGARLGANALSGGLKAGIIGICLVLLFMLVVYRILGFSADWALVIYIGLELMALSLFQVTLTLPGIAGIVLSIGMAVDANVVIFERIKEELNMGKSLRASVDHGFSRALPAILDGNITTLIAAVVLFWLGSGTVKGFAQTLMIGIIISMFTALVISRIIVKGFIAIGINKPTFFGKKKE